MTPLEIALGVYWLATSLLSVLACGPYDFKRPFDVVAFILLSFALGWAIWTIGWLASAANAIHRMAEEE